MKKVIAILLTLLILLTMASCGLFDGKTLLHISSKIKIPDLEDVDEISAKTSITNKGLLPVIVYEYSDTVVKGNVTRTSPIAGSEVDPDTKVTIYVSSGPRSISAQDATVEWYHIDSSHPDEWSFYGLEICEGYLYIDCETTFGTSFTLKGSGFGNASLTDSFDKYVPLTILDENLKSFPENKEIKAGEVFKFCIKIPLASLDSERPTYVACEIVTLIDGRQDEIKVSFNASW